MTDKEKLKEAIWFIGMFCDLAEHFYKPYGCASGLIRNAKEFTDDYNRENKPQDSERFTQ